MTDILKNSIYHTINHISAHEHEHDEAQKQSANAATTATLRQEIQELRDMIKMMVDTKNTHSKNYRRNLASIAGPMDGVHIMAHSAKQRQKDIRKLPL